MSPECHAEVEKLKTFKYNWNSYDAEPPSPSAIQIAMKLVDSLCNSGLEPCRVVPSAIGGVGITIRWFEGRKAYLEVRNDGKSHLLLSDGETEPYVEKIDLENTSPLFNKIRSYLFV